MELTLAVLCDYATVSQEGKLSILGIFDRIDLVELPARIPSMWIVSTYQADSKEAGTAHKIRITMTDPEGKDTFSAEQPVTIPSLASQVGRVSVNHLFGIAGPEFRKAGEYAVRIYVDENESKRLPLMVTIQDRKVIPSEVRN